MLHKTQLCITYLLIVYTLLGSSRFTEDTTSAVCKTWTDCINVTRYSLCEYGYCTCEFGYHNVTTDKSANLSECVTCPEVGESCLQSNCCIARDSSNVYCKNGTCVSECYYCGGTDLDGRYRFEQIAQFILGSALFFTLAILFILFWKACTRRRTDGDNMPHCESFISINSIQRLVLLRLQDRPPPYGSFTQTSKSNTNQNCQRQISYEAPPPYSSVISSANNDGVINHSFYIGEQPTSRQPDGEIPNSGQQLESAYKPEIHI